LELEGHCLGDALGVELQMVLLCWSSRGIGDAVDVDDGLLPHVVPDGPDWLLRRSLQGTKKMKNLPTSVKIKYPG
jgi:hypothetical protein